MASRSADERLDSLDFGRAGFVAARGRLEAAMTGEALLPVGLAAAEVTVWLCSVSDLSPTKGIEPPILWAFRWARNRAVHDLLVKAERRGLTFPVVFPVVLGDAWRWSRVDELGYIRDDPDDRDRRDLYRRLLAGRTLTQTINEAVAALPGIDGG